MRGGAPGETLRLRLEDLSCLALESTRAIRIVASLDISVQAPQVTLSTPQELCTSRSPLQAQGQIALLIPKGTGGGNPPTGGGDTTLTMHYQFDALGQEGILCGTDFQFYNPFPDTPAEFDFGSWIANIALGVAVTLAFVGLAVVTGGTSLILTGALVGAAVGSGVATAAIAVSDYNSGNVRSLGEAAFGITLGGSLGALAGAAIAGLITIGPANIIKPVMDFASKSFTFPPPFTPSLQLVGGGILSGGAGLTITGAQILAGAGALAIPGIFYFASNHRYDDDSPIFERIGRQHGNAPRDNQKQNKQAKAARKAAEKILGRDLSDAEWRMVHNAITRQGLSFEEIIEVILDFFT